MPSTLSGSRVRVVALAVTAAATLWAGAASAQFVDHDKVRCEPRTKEELRPQMELQRLLVAQGWRVRQIKTFNGCYEVYAIDAKGAKVETIFNPQTGEPVGSEGAE